MFRIRIPQSVRDHDAITCSTVKLTIRTKFETGMLLLAEALHSKNPTQVAQYNAQLDFARAQAELSRLNR